MVKVAMQTAEVYEISAFADMEDDLGIRNVPIQPGAEGILLTRQYQTTTSLLCQAALIRKKLKIAFAYDLYTEPVEGYTPHDQILEQYYPQFRDDRAVD